MKSKLLRKIVAKILHYFAPHYGTCGICGMPWKFTKFHSVFVKDKIGCFAVCEHCWNHSSDEEIIKAFDNLYSQWMVEGGTHQEIGFRRYQLLNKVTEEVRNRKNKQNKDNEKNT